MSVTPLQPGPLGSCLVPDCTADAPADAPVALCPPHLRMAFHHVLDMLGCDLVDVLPSRSLGLVPAQPTQVPARIRGYVYYVRRDDLVKIGTSMDVRKRMQQLCCDLGDVLAVEPGDRELERMRHEQFADDRMHGEWFCLTPELQRHIDMLVEHFGAPMRHMIAAS